MEALILNRKFQTERFLDNFESFIWSDRFNDVGDFEIYMPMTQALLEYVKIDNYVWRHGTDRLMIIENITIDTDAEKGPHITFTGRSLESLLERRVIAKRFEYSGPLETGIQQLIVQNITSPSNYLRRIPNFRFVYSNDPKIESITWDVNYLGETVLEAVQNACNLNELGFKVVFNEEMETFDFSLYRGEDRSYDQEKNPWVVFSPQYENLTASNFYETHTALRTAAIVVGDPDYDLGQMVLDIDGKPDLNLSGIDRRETYVDAEDIPIPDPEVDEDAIRAQWEYRGEEYVQQKINEAWEEAWRVARADYHSQMVQRAEDELAKTYITKTFDGEIEAVRQYVYDRDFYLGDIVQIRDEFGLEASSRITEVVMTHDTSGESLIPTFTTRLGGANEGDISG